MSTGEMALRERRLRALLDRLASEADPEQAARLMREYERLARGSGTDSAAGAEPPDRISHPTPTGTRPSKPEP